MWTVVIFFFALLVVTPDCKDEHLFLSDMVSRNPMDTEIGEPACGDGEGVSETSLALKEEA